MLEWKYFSEELREQTHHGNADFPSGLFPSPGDVIFHPLSLQDGRAGSEIAPPSLLKWLDGRVG